MDQDILTPENDLASLPPLAPPRHFNSWKISTFFLFAIVAALLYKDYLNTEKLKKIVLQQTLLCEQKLPIPSYPQTNSTDPISQPTPTPTEAPKELGLMR